MPRGMMAPDCRGARQQGARTREMQQSLVNQRTHENRWFACLLNLLERPRVEGGTKTRKVETAADRHGGWREDAERDAGQG